MTNIIAYILNIIFPIKIRYGEIVNIGKNSFFKGSSFVKKFDNTNKVNIGNNSVLFSKIYLENSLATINIGDNVYIGSSSIYCSKNVNIGNNVLISWGVKIYDHNSHSLSSLERLNDIKNVVNALQLNKKLTFGKDWANVKSNEITIKDNVWIGMDSLILKGVTIGENSIIAARSVVTKDVQPNTIVGGNPAIFLKNV